MSSRTTRTFHKLAIAWAEKAMSPDLEWLRGRGRRSHFVAGTSLLVLLALPRGLGSAVIVVDETCSLADAITAANTDAGAGGCTAGSGADELQLTGDVILTESLPAITTDMTVNGGDFTVERSAAAAAFRIFEVLDAAFTIESVIVRNGEADAGGAIRLADGSLTVSNSVLSGNSAESGGAIFADTQLFPGSLLLVNSTISGNTAENGGGIWHETNYTELVNSRVEGNHASERGGGVFARSELEVTEGSSITGNFASENGGGIAVVEWANVLVADSSVSYNSSAGSGGGIYMANSNGSYGFHTLNLVNTTLAGNHAGGSGGALTLDVGYEYFGFLPITIENSTISGNSAVAGGGGLEHLTGRVILTNTTVTGNSAPSGSGVELTADDDFELIGSIVAGNLGGANCSGSGLGAADIERSFADGTCSSAAPIVPGADFDTELGDNGGPTATHALLTNSVAIDAGENCGLLTDQRGFLRETGACDSGAFEFGVGPFPLSLAGECPGMLTASVLAAVPGSVVELFEGSGPGNTPVPSGPCVGTALGIANAQSVASLVADADGAGTVVFDFDGGDCGQLLQAVDEGDCDVSSIETIDSCHKLTLGHTGSGSDPVAATPGSPGCPDGEYLPGTIVDLTAFPDPGWLVGSWSGSDDDDNDSDTNTVTMPAADQEVTVNYVALVLSATGTCPGEVTLTINGASPNGQVGLLASGLEGILVKPQPPCKGLVLGLDSPILLATLTADANGEVQLTRELQAGACGRFLQAAELAVCAPSAVAQLP